MRDGSLQGRHRRHEPNHTGPQATQCASPGPHNPSIALNSLNDPEYALRALTNTQFIEGCSNGILRCGALASEIQGWLNLLAGGTNRAQVLTDFVESPEFQLRLDQVIVAGPFAL